MLCWSSQETNVSKAHHKNMMQVSQQMAREINERCHMHNKKINNSKVVHTKCMVQNADIIFGAKKQALKNCNLRKIKI